MHPLLVLALAILVVFVLIIRLKINAFIALIVAAITVGVLAPGVAFPDVMPAVVRVFGDVAGRIAIVIAMAAVIGACLMESGAADKITRVFVRMLGEKHSSFSLLGSSYVLAGPVFFDTVFYLLVPLAKAMRIRTGGHYLLFVMAVVAGGAVTHTMVPPTPGPFAAATALNVDLGIMIVAGMLIGIPMALAGWLFSAYMDRVLPVPLRETAGLSITELEELANRDEQHLPGFFASILPIALPVLLITCNTVVGAVAPESGLRRITAFFGDPNLALLLSATISLRLLAVHRNYSLMELARPVQVSLASAGVIILITAAGGAFGGMLVQAGVGTSLGELAREYSVPLLLLGFLLAALLKIAQGSGTVAMITTSSILAPLLLETPPTYHPVYVVCAIGCGSLIGSWMNDSGFWVYKEMSGVTEIEALKTWTPLLIVLGVSGFLVTLIAATVLPLR
jgi:gluconate:H+ symporter, GntP family